MIPKSRTKYRRESWALWCTLVTLITITAVLIWLHSAYPTWFSAASHDKWHIADVLVATLSGLLAMVLFIWISFRKSYDILEHRWSFLTTFGVEPDKDREIVQRTVSAVLEGLRRKAQGAFGREVGAQRQHAEEPSDVTAEELNRRRTESKNLKKKFWYAVEDADDWGYAVPTSIDEEIVQ